MRDEEPVDAAQCALEVGNLAVAGSLIDVIEPEVFRYQRSC